MKALKERLRALVKRAKRLRRRIAQLQAAKVTSISPAGLALIKEFEGLPNFHNGRAYLYDDPVGYATIGYGHLVAYKPVAHLSRAEYRPWKNGLTEADASELLRKDLKEFEDGVVHLFDSANLNRDQFSSLVSFAYNLGLASLAGSTLRKVILHDPNPASETSIRKEFEKWVYAGDPPRVLAGLVRRRRAEADLYFGKKPTR